MADLPVASAALTEKAAEFDALAEEDHQLGLFSEPVTEAGRAKFADRARGPGRPPGARNRRTEATVAALLSHYRDPRKVALERIQMHPADLAALLGCSIAEADDKQRLWAAAVFPYVANKLTPEVIDARTAVQLNVYTGAGEPGVGAVEYQRVSDAPSDDVGQDDVGQ